MIVGSAQVQWFEVRGSIVFRRKNVVAIAGPGGLGVTKVFLAHVDFSLWLCRQRQIRFWTIPKIRSLALV
jgi:hypothetical protein